MVFRYQASVKKYYFLNRAYQANFNQHLSQAMRGKGLILYMNHVHGAKRSPTRLSAFSNEVLTYH
jgi:hypothetical protein